MTKTRGFIRQTTGNAFLPIVAFIITGALAVSSLTGFTQFLTVKDKIDQSLIEGERAGLVYISDNLTNSSIIQNPAQANLILNNARTIAISRAVASLGQPTRLMLIERNGPELTNLYQNSDTVFELSAGGDKVRIQLGVSTNVLGAVPFRYNKKTLLREIRPSDIDNIITTPSLECNATNDCGECGLCDQSIGECIPNLSVPNKEPEDEPDAQGKFACKDYEDTVPGEFCTDDAGGVIFTAANGQEGCNETGCTGPDCPSGGPGVNPGDPDPDPDGFDCRFLDNFFAWNIIGDPSTGDIKVYWDGTLIDSTGFTAADTTFTDPNGDTYTRSTLFPFGVNQDDPGNDTFALCKGNLGPPPLDPSNSGRRVFITAETFTGDLVHEANRRAGFTNPNDPNRPFRDNDPQSAANTLCTSAANSTMPGTWLALLGYDGGDFYNIAPIGNTDFKYYRVRSNQTGQNDMLGGDWNFNNLLYSPRPYNALEVTQFGNHLSTTEEKSIWGGYGIMVSGQRGLTGPRGRYYVRASSSGGWHGWRDNTSANCNNWTTTADTGWFGLHIRSGAYGYGQWGHWGNMALDCAATAHLYCVESETTDIRNW